MNCQIMRVISSPSSSTTVPSTLILDMWYSRPPRKFPLVTRLGPRFVSETTNDSISNLYNPYEPGRPAPNKTSVLLTDSGATAGPASANLPIGSFAQLKRGFGP